MIFLDTFCKETFCSRKRSVEGNVVWQETFCSMKRLVAGNVLCRKHSVRKRSVDTPDF